MSSIFGKRFTLTTFGESHGRGVGGVIDGVPAGINLDLEFIQYELSRRRPGQSKLTTNRKEEDKVEILSGIFEGKTTGHPIGFLVRNSDQHSKDYDSIRNLFRPSHADYTYYSKYGIRDHRGGGRSSARITIARCVAGALAKLILKQYGINVQAYVSSVGEISLDKDYRKYNFSNIENNPVRCPDEIKAKQMEELILNTKKRGDTIGGVITCIIKGCPVGIGEPEADKLHATLGSAMLSINAAKGFEIGEGFDIAKRFGSEVNDIFTINENNKIHTRSNYSGGIQGGISNGEDIYFRVAFKPIATLLMQQETIDIEGNTINFTTQGRHDSCVVPRAVPIVEAMAAMTILDFILIARS